ncbi:glycosyltransferase family 2 protein [Phenylobacterium sp.]|uniref:glycosyltransferase family 2 protein n=1 Tax=Phenylobacterium sp. TaxID=1871053 RepID=UPI00301B9FC6
MKDGDMQRTVSGPGHVVVAIVAFRNADDIKRCLTALSRSTYPNFSVYVCENGGGEAFRRLCDETPERLPSGQRVIRIDAGDNLGYAGGVNRCLKEADPHYKAVWVLNPDTEPQPEALEALLRRLDKGDVDAVGGVITWNEDVVQSYGGLWRPWLGIGASMGMFSKVDAPIDAAAIERRLGFLSGASMLVSARFIEVAGLMRDDYFLYAEEVEWCLRARQKGMRLGFTPDARVLHHLGTTTGWSGADFRKWPRLPIYLDARNRVRMTAQLMPLHLPTAVVGILLHSLWRYARRGAWRQVGYVLQGVVAGLRGEAGRPAWVK